jgi:hypothetical protein
MNGATSLGGKAAPVTAAATGISSWGARRP